MTSKLLLTTLATATLIFGAPAYSCDDKDDATQKDHGKCDPAKEKDCKGEQKKGDSQGSKDDHKHDKK